jgi:hypothetical protein
MNSTPPGVIVLRPPSGRLWKITVDASTGVVAMLLEVLFTGLQF